MSRLVANTSHPVNNHYSSNPDTIWTNLVCIELTSIWLNNLKMWSTWTGSFIFLNINFAAPWTLLLVRQDHWPSSSYALVGSRTLIQFRDGIFQNACPSIAINYSQKFHTIYKWTRTHKVTFNKKFWTRHSKNWLFLWITRNLYYPKVSSSERQGIVAFCTCQ